MGKERQVDVGASGCKAIAQSCAVNIQRHIVLLAQLVQFVKFLRRVDSTKLCRESDVYKPREYSMHVVAVGKEILHKVLKHVRSQLAVVVWHVDNLVLGEFYGACLMGIDMSGVYGYDTLV